MTLESSTFTVKGRGTPILAAIGIITILAAAIPLYLTATGHQLPLGNVVRIWLIVCALDTVLVAVAIYFFSRRLSLSGDFVHMSTLLGCKTWRVHEITGVSVQRDMGGEDSTGSDYIAFWRDDKILGRLNLFGVPREALSCFLATLRRRNPKLVLAPEAQALVGSVGT